MNSIDRKCFLFEIGTDELPARFLPVEQAFVQKEMQSALDSMNLPYEQLRVLVTPRRLAIIIDGVSVAQEDVEVELKGPPANIAFDDDGQPTAAANGFAKKNNLELSELYEIDDGKGKFVGAKKIMKGKSISELLSEKIPSILSAIPFPKVMRWGLSDFEYARPVQWLVALLGRDVVEIEFAGITANRVSMGHRTLAQNREIVIETAESYTKSLSDNYVIVDQDKRGEVIQKGIDEVLKQKKNAACISDDNLFEEVTNLSEFPTPFIGSYSEDFFALPDEVIVSALKSHQRYFSIIERGGKSLLPYFVSVRDGNTDFLDNVIHGNEKVLNARLSDALFYFQFDQRKSPDQHTENLANVTWIEGYGSVLDKVHRVRELVDWLWKNGLGEGELPKDLRRAADIYKFDLVTEMIRDGKEFTKLEGLIGARYASVAGEGDEVCNILEEYNKPRSASDSVSQNRLASILSIAERVDTLAGCWIAGFSPTGAKDAYALRRHTLSVLRILSQHDFHIDLPDLIEAAFSGYKSDSPELIQEVRLFVETRMIGFFEAKGYSNDVVKAVLKCHGGDPIDTDKWINALSEFKGQADFQKLASGFKRCRNILKGNILTGQEMAESSSRWGKGGMTPSGKTFSELPENAEIVLRNNVSNVVVDLLRAEKRKNYKEVFTILSGLGPAIDDFFDTVMVNVENTELKELRHDFLREVHALFARYADFSEIVLIE